MGTQALRDSVERINTLPVLPGILKRLLGLIENPRVSLNQISDFVSSDPALASRVLKMVNSPVYGFPGRISSVNQGVILLGLNVVKGLLLGVTVFDLMQKSMVGLWEHSVGCAVVARIIAKRMGFREPEEISVGGLLHDLGKVILILRFPKEYGEAMELAEADGRTIGETEKDRFPANHASAGAWVARKWSFPKNLTDIMEYHHKPHLARVAPYQTAIVHLSDVLIRGRGYGFAGDRCVPPVNPATWERFQLTKEDMKKILAEAEDALEMTKDLIL
ncbi:MAG: HDOD domain-containing protein [Syntrophorhabdus aromaticivorans]|uniref:HDOD domain-containing protein n=2 Tax=Syntrophorhabdus aromaticivorans TaxID=328301 RepID=A0A971M241_9BACT|nr:HDOD domain-containing protein [Syntrophorhabdus aromaticivorans]